VIATTLFGSAALALAVALHPLSTYPLSLALLRRVSGIRRPGPVPAPGAPRPTFSLLVCAHNEEQVIREKLANLQALLDTAPGSEALLYVDGSSDRTAVIVEAFPDQRIRAVISLERTGKTVGLNRLAASARGDVLVLSDANVTVQADALSKLALRFADPAVGLVCGHLRYVNGEANTAARNGATYWRLEEVIRELESETGGAIGADGSLYAVRRSLWPAVPADLIDDFYVPMSVRFRGFRVIRAGEVMAFERTAEDDGDEFRRKVRIACQAFNVHRRLWPVIRYLPLLDRYKYVSHKLLKWLIGFHLAGATLLALAGLAVALEPATLAWSAAGASAALALGILLRLPALGTLLNALLMFAAVALGVVRSVQGERYVTWQPAASVRAGQVSLMPPPSERAG
jgi:cellulose synthase/poly-beta-1,6-N-acetylglucosamine synthase-like glycosyltransferase